MTSAVESEKRLKRGKRALWRGGGEGGYEK
jgi:hypothetical protein